MLRISALYRSSASKSPEGLFSSLRSEGFIKTPMRGREAKLTVGLLMTIHEVREPEKSGVWTGQDPFVGIPDPACSFSIRSFLKNAHRDYDPFLSPLRYRGLAGRPMYLKFSASPRMPGVRKMNKSSFFYALFQKLYMVNLTSSEPADRFQRSIRDCLHCQWHCPDRFSQGPGSHSAHTHGRLSLQRHRSGLSRGS